MKRKSRATRFSEAVSQISSQRDAFETMQAALTEVNESIEAVGAAVSPNEKNETKEALAGKIAEAEKSLTEHSGAFENTDVSQFEELRDELQEWHDNLPENLQSGSKADELDEAVSNLEEAIQYVEDINSAGDDFSGVSGFEAHAVENRINALETAIENIDNLEGVCVDFPRMFG